MVQDIGFDVNCVFTVLPTMYVEILPNDRLLPVLSSHAAEQPTLAYLAGLGKSSRRSMGAALGVIAAILTNGECSPAAIPWHQLKWQHVNAVRAKLTEHYSPATGRKYMSALRGVMTAAWKLGLMDAESMQRALLVPSIRGEGPDQAAGRALTSGEIAALMNTCRDDSGPAGPRDGAIIGVGVCCGLRRAEIANLELADYSREISQLIVFGKGRKQRTLYTTPVDDIMADWLHVRGSGDGPLFRSVRNGHIINRPITPGSVWKMVQRRAAVAGVKAFGPHDMRRTFAGDLLDAGVDLVTVQKLMGHSSANTTAGYDRRGERAKKEAAGRLHLPWTRRYE